jgi:flagellar basal body-associated protein FliL
LKGIVVWQFYLYVVALLILTAASSALQFWLFKKKSAKTNGSADIDEHFDQMQNKL